MVLPREPEGGTGIGSGIAAAIRMLDRNDIEAPRQVVDVSGDGRETPAREVVVLMPAARAMARARGVTVNGLAILCEQCSGRPGVGNLEADFTGQLIGGPGAFVVTADGREAFAAAVRRKLILEIAGLTPADPVLPIRSSFRQDQREF